MPTRCNWNYRGSGSSTLFNSKICSKNRFPLFLSRETDVCWKHSGLVSVSARLLSISPFFVAPFFSILSRVWMGNRCAWGVSYRQLKCLTPRLLASKKTPDAQAATSATINSPGKKIQISFLFFSCGIFVGGGKERYKWLLDSPCTLSPKVGK